MQPLRIAIAGFGFMGRMHWRCWKQVPGVVIVAVCDSNLNLVKDTQKAVGNIAGAADAVDFSQVKIYTDFDVLLAEQRLDAVSITVPTFLHPDYTEKALSAGVNVLCEKPMALNIAECDRMVAAARRSGRHLQIGHCVRFWPEYAKAKELVDSGRYGAVLAGSFRRLGSAPNWGAGNWFSDEALSGGMPLDLHIHDTDYIQYLFGMPQAVAGFGVRDKHGRILHIVTQYLYEAPSGVITAEGGWVMAPSFGFEMSFNLVLEKATIVYDCTRQPAFRVCPADGGAFTPPVAPGDGYSQQIDHLARRLRGESLPEVTTPQQARDAVRIVEAEKESLRIGQKVYLD